MSTPLLHSIEKLTRLARVMSAQSEASITLTRAANEMMDDGRLSEAKLALAETNGIMRVVNACLEILNEPAPVR